MTRGPSILSATLLACTVAGCEAPLRLRPGMAGLIVRVRAEPKAGYTPPSVTGGGDPYANPSMNAAPVEYGRFERIDYDALENIVVWAEPREAPAPALTPPPITVDVARTSAPADGPVHVTGVGGRVVLRSRRNDAVVIYSVSDGNEFDLGRIAPDGEAAWTARAPGLVEVLCDGCPEPVALVYVAPSGWVARTRSGESARFADLPPGRYRVACWHPRLPGSETEMMLPADRATRVSLAVGVNSLPKVP